MACLPLPVAQTPGWGPRHYPLLTPHRALLDAVPYCVHGPALEIGLRCDPPHVKGVVSANWVSSQQYYFQTHKALIVGWPERPRSQYTFLSEIRTYPPSIESHHCENKCGQYHQHGGPQSSPGARLKHRKLPQGREEAAEWHTCQLVSSVGRESTGSRKSLV